MLEDIIAQARRQRAAEFESPRKLKSVERVRRRAKLTDLRISGWGGPVDQIPSASIRGAVADGYILTPPPDPR